MEHYPIRSFRPIETKSENTDQDRTVLRLCDGFLSVPIGALSSGPQWKSLWGLDDFAAQAATVLAAASANLAHFITVTRGNHVWLVVWSLATSKPLGMFYVTTGAPTEFDFDATTSVTLASTNNAVYRDKNASAYWFASRIGDRWFIGNGVDDNVQWKNGALLALGPSSPPADIYDNSKVKIPACTSFVMNETKSIFASGNAATPKRVWITHPPTAAFPFNEGIYSTDTSFIDVSFSEATKITALSAFQNYVTAHTDAKPVNLFDVDGTTDGWKCRQSQGAANASAPSPAAVRDTNGMASFYVGTDGEVYEDQAIRVGPNDKRPARDQDIATRLSADDWNRDMNRPVTKGKVHTIYDRTTQHFWIFAELEEFTGRFGLWAYNERSRSIVGPFSYPNALVSACVSGHTDGNSQYVAVITATGAMLYSDMSNIGEVDEFMNEDPGLALGSDYAILAAAPTPTPGLSYVAQTANQRVFAEIMAGPQQMAMPNPWGFFSSNGTYTFTRFFNDAYVARFETGYMDFGDAKLQKNFLELVMTWQRHSRAYVGIYAQTEDGRDGGKFKGLVFEKETHTIPINLFGRRIRVRVVAILFNAAPALLRDVSIGWLPAGKT